MRIFLMFIITVISFLNGITISGYVVLDEKPLKDVKVSVFIDEYENPKSLLSTNTDILGHYRMDLPNKRYEATYYLTFEYLDKITLVAPKKSKRFQKELSFGKISIYLPEHINIARKLKPKLFEPKGEFENTRMYISRKKEKELFLEKVRVEQDNKRALENRKEEILKKRIIEDSIEKAKVVVGKIGRYDADRENFSSILVVFSKQKNLIFHKVKVSKIAGMLDSAGSNFIASKEETVKDENKNILGNLEIGKSYPTTKNNKILSAFYEIYYSAEIVKETSSMKYSSIPIPLEHAQSFKKNLKSVKGSGLRKLDKYLKSYIYYNVELAYEYENFNGLISEHKIKLGKWESSNEKNRKDKKILPPNLEMMVAFMEPNENGFLDARETGEFKVSLSNKGLGTAFNVNIELLENSKNKYLKYSPLTFVGDINPGETKIKRVKVEAQNKVQKVANTFVINAIELNSFNPDPTKVTFETFPFIPPELVHVDFGIETADGTNIIKPSIGTSLQVRIQNQGKGEAKDVTFKFNTPKNLFLSPDSKTEYSFSSLKQGEFKDLDFEFFVNNKVSSSIKIFIDYIEESTEGQFELELDIKKTQQSINELVIRGRELKNTAIENVATISVDVEKNIPKTKRKSKYDLAIVFGIESYKDVPGVSFARRDAVWMKEYFQKTFNIPSNRIYTRTDADVGQAEFRKVFSKGGWIDKRIKKDKTNIFFYFAGHGAPNINDNKGYLIPYDGDPNYASQTGYSLEELYKEMNRFSSKSATVFLDACFSGVNRNNEMLLADARPVFLEVDESYTDKVNVFSAAESKQISSSWPEKKHGLFSYFLMKGMKGDADFNKDKKLTFGELGRYLKENVSSTAGLLDREQTPSLLTQNENKIFIQY
ncbi:caspase family protein [Candidatus Marinimicrobia bacterium]|nr:caspase family protein [Candidatus Neomarinimicrobiota bacterium]